MIPFRPLATATAVLLLCLAWVWFAWPDWILVHWSLPYSYGAGFLARRMACFFLAAAVILWSLRKTQSAEAKAAVVNGMVAACLSLIVSGLWEYVTGHAGWGIFFAIGLESVLLTAFAAAGFSPAASAKPAAPVR
ncbi:MAG: hypothetical protein JF615_10310 [Asticcacaulis sp.]|nr:hypothetical protein [Asticcacaulis sp.]